MDYLSLGLFLFIASLFICIATSTVINYLTLGEFENQRSMSRFFALFVSFTAIDLDLAFRKRKHFSCSFINSTNKNSNKMNTLMKQTQRVYTTLNNPHNRFDKSKTELLNCFKMQSHRRDLLSNNNVNRKYIILYFTQKE